MASCTFLCRQLVERGGDCITWHRLQEEICPNPRSTSFYRAMQLSIGVVLILDEKATPFSRIWCCFEESIAAARLNAPEGKTTTIPMLRVKFPDFPNDFTRLSRWKNAMLGCPCSWMWLQLILPTRPRKQTGPNAAGCIEPQSGR